MVKNSREKDKTLLEPEIEAKIEDSILFKNRIVFLYGEIDNDTAKEINKN